MENAMTYYKYPTFVEKLVANEETARFPQITMCPNALHALSKINTQFPKLNLTLLEELYSGNTSFFEGLIEMIHHYLVVQLFKKKCNDSPNIIIFRIRENESGKDGELRKNESRRLILRFYPGWSNRIKWIYCINEENRLRKIFGGDKSDHDGDRVQILYGC